MVKKTWQVLHISKNIELKKQNNQNENQFDTLPLLINQIIPSKFHIIPNTVINKWVFFGI